MQTEPARKMIIRSGGFVSNKAALLAACLVIVAMAAGCGSSSNSSSGKTASNTAAAPMSMNDLIKAAKAEGTVTYYTAQAPSVLNAQTSAFTKKYGIKVTTVRLAGAELDQRFSSEAKAGVHAADLLEVADPTIFQQNPSWFAQLTPEFFPNLKTLKPGYNQATSLVTELVPEAIQYNSKTVTDPPKSWQDVLSPKYKGKIVLSSPAASTPWIDWASNMQSTFGTDFLTKLKAQNPTIVASATPGAQEVASGAYDLSFPSIPAQGTALAAAGASIKYVIPLDPEVGIPYYGNVTTNSPHPYAGRLLLDFITSSEGQQIGCAVAPSSSALSTLPTGCIAPDASYKPYRPSDIITADRKAQLLQDLGISDS